MPLPVDPSHTIPAAGEPVGLTPTPADREHVVDTLARHYAFDRLTEGELQARLDRVYLATTPAQLRAVLADLPVEPAPVPAVPAKQIHALLSGQEQKLTGSVPRRLQLRARLGYVELDLSRAALQEGRTEIEVNVLAGYVEIHLPPGTEVESDGRAILGYVAVKGPAPDPAERPPCTVHITGRVLLGYTECFRKSARPLPPGVLGWLERWRRGGEDA